MPNQLKLAAFALLLSTVSIQLSTAFAQGSLTPPGAPAPTMKTLSQIEPRTPISSVPYSISIPGSYYLANSVTGAVGLAAGITITCGNVTFDLNGFTLQGVPGSAVGIYVLNTCTNIVVRNGTVTSWGSHGIDSYSSTYARNQVFENLTVSANNGYGLYIEGGSVVKDCLSIGNVNAGIYCSGGGEIVRCISRNNGSTGINVYNCTVRDCRSETNWAYGIYLNQSRALNCSVENNANIGLWLESTGNEVRGCRVVGNKGRGVYCNTATTGDVIADNLIESNTDLGIQINGPGNRVIGNNVNLNAGGGIWIYDNNNRIDGNCVQVASGSSGIGVNTAAFTNNVIIRNIVSGAGGNNYYNPGANDFGPIGSAATATSPWANISH